MPTPPLNSSDWESLCRRCGRCCYEKLEFEGEIYYTDQPCPHLDLENRQCHIYPDRATLHPECALLTPEVVSKGWLPADCPYVADLKDYVPPHLWVDES